MRNFTLDAIVIKRRNFGEADRLLTVFSLEFGKLQIKATGVRRITSRRASHIELLNNVRLTLYKGKGTPILTEATTINDFSDVKNDLTKVGYAYHLCELVEGLCPQDQENRKVYFLLREALHRLEEEDHILGIIHDFEVELLTVLGFWNHSMHAHPSFNTQTYIENILERRLKSRAILHKMVS